MAGLTVNASSSHVRIALRAAFTILLLLMGVLGDKCCVMRTRLRLYHRQLVDVHHTTGWLGVTNVAKTFIAFRRSPTGWVGLVMLITGIMGIVSDLAVSGLVSGSLVVSRCLFNTTGPYATLAIQPFNLLVGVDNAGDLFDMVNQAQVTSQSNGGLDGIYQKVNTESNFRADAKDVVGQWTCNATGSTSSFSPSSKDEDIITSLVDVGFLFPQAYSWSFEFMDSGLETDDFFAWSASQNDTPTGPWTVLAAVDTTSNSSDEKVMEIYSCSLDAASLDWLLPLIEVQTALESWVEICKESIYGSGHVANPAPPADPGSAIASSLNTIMMLAGVSWNNTLNPRVIVDPYQGCNAHRTSIPALVCALFIAVVSGTLGMGVYLTVLMNLCRVARRGHTADFVKAVQHGAPNGLISWMSQALIEASVSNSEKNAPKLWTKQWRLGSVGDPRFIGLVRLGDIVEQTELTPSLWPPQNQQKFEFVGLMP